MKRIISSLTACICVCLCLTGCGERPEWGEKVYSTVSYAGSAAYYRSSGDIVCAYFSDPGRMYHACIDPLCTNHMYPYCDAAPATLGSYSTLVAMPEGRVLPLIYTHGTRNPDVYDENGERKRLPDNEWHMGVVTEFDAETGKSREIAYTELSGSQLMLIYKGVLYLSSGAAVCSVDIATGECKYPDSDVDRRLIGIWDGRLYMMDSLGVVYSTAPDFSDLREVYDCMGGTVGVYEGDACVDGGMLYFERNVKKESKDTDTYVYIRTKDVYAVRLTDSDPRESLVAGRVSVWKASGGDLYYSLFEYKEYDAVDVGGVQTVPRSYDGGTLYRYDAGTGESEVCFSDIGVSITEITDIADGMMLFHAWHYRDLDPEANGEFYDSVCLADIGTGEWRVISHDNFISLNQQYG